MSVVCNSSPLIALARINQFSLLHKIYNEITIPDAVWNEVVIQGENRAGVKEIEAASWIRKKQVSNKDLVHALRQKLGAGEAESIALAIELSADILILDERLGRDMAHFFNVPYLGIIGVLIQAKRKGYITEIKPLLDNLRQRAAFRISDSLYFRILKDMEEK